MGITDLLRVHAFSKWIFHKDKPVKSETIETTALITICQIFCLVFLSMIIIFR